MFVYKKEEDNLKIYDFYIDEDAALEYRKKQMGTIPKERTIFVAKAYNSKVKKPVFEKYKGNLKSTVFKMYNINHLYKNHVLVPAKYNDDEIIYLLNKFYNGEFSDKGIAKVLDDNSLRYFLLTEDKYWHSFSLSDSKEMSNIIEVPEGLYILQLLEQAAFPYIKDFDIEEQLELFTLKYVDDVCLDEIRKMDEYKVSEGIYTKVLNKIEKDVILFKKYEK